MDYNRVGNIIAAWSLGLMFAAIVFLFLIAD